MKNLLNQLFNKNKGISKGVKGTYIQSSNPGTVFAGYSGSIWITGSYITNKQKVLVLAGSRISFDTFLALGDGIDKNHDYFFVEKETDLEDGCIGGFFEIKILDDFCLHSNIAEILRFISKKKLFLYT